MKLNDAQFSALQTEMAPNACRDSVLAEVYGALTSSSERVIAFNPEQYTHVRAVGRRQLPTTVGGLLVHCAEHTQRHTGQAITTAKLLLAQRTT